MAKQLRANTHHVKNVIQFVVDYMGVTTTARILEDPMHGKSDKENQLSFEALPYVALSKIYNTH